MSDTHVQDAVREKYGDIARSVGKTGCCGPTACGCGDPITSDLYSDAETAGLPADAVAVSLGCGNPTALIDLQPGQTVLDLGSGGGIDVLLSAKRVGPTGKVYGLDMTDPSRATDAVKPYSQNVAVSHVANGSTEEFLKSRSDDADQTRPPASCVACLRKGW